MTLRLGVPGSALLGVGTPTAVTLRSFTFISLASPATPSGFVAESTRLKVRSKSMGSRASALIVVDWRPDPAWATESKVLVALTPVRAGTEERDRRYDDSEAKNVSSCDAECTASWVVV